MPSQVLQDLIDEVAAERTVIASAVAYIVGVPGLIKAAVDSATANGATAAELSPLTDLITAMKADSQALADAMAANTPTPTPPVVPPIP